MLPVVHGRWFYLSVTFLAQSRLGAVGHLPSWLRRGGWGPLCCRGASYPQHRKRGGAVEDMGDGGGLQLQTSPSLRAGGQAGVMAKVPRVRPRGAPVVRGQGQLPQGTCQAKAAACRVSRAINN